MVAGRCTSTSFRSMCSELFLTVLLLAHILQFIFAFHSCLAFSRSNGATKAREVVSKDHSMVFLTLHDFCDNVSLQSFEQIIWLIWQHWKLNCTRRTRCLPSDTLDGMQLERPDWRRDPRLPALKALWIQNFPEGQCDSFHHRLPWQNARFCQISS